MGLVLLVVGVVVAAYPSNESFSVETTVGSWGVTTPIWPSTLNGTDKPGNSTFWGRGGMSRYSWYEFSLAFSGPVRLSVSYMTNPDSPSGGTKNAVFNQVVTAFDDRVNAGPGTWQVDIVNEGLTPVDIVPGSFVVAKESLSETRVGYPYSLYGTFVALLGVVVLVVGVVSKSKVKRKKA